MLSSPHAMELLSVMSLLSDGISDLDLSHSRLPIPHLSACKATLVRTSLAYVDHVGRFKVLAPIRDYIHAAHPPSPPLVRPLRKHLGDLLILWETLMHRSSFAVDLTPRLVSNLGNLHNLFHHGLDSAQEDRAESMHGILLLNDLNLVMNRGRTPLMLRLPELLAEMDDHHLRGRFIGGTLHAWQFNMVPDPEKSIDEAIEHFRIIKDVHGEGEYTQLKDRLWLSVIRVSSSTV
jgi:hypothetical protein